MHCLRELSRDLCAQFLENCDLAQPNTWRALIRAQLQQHFPDGAVHQASRERSILELLHRLQDSTFTAGMALAQLSPVLSPGVQFLLRLDSVDAERLHQVLSDWLQSQSLPTAPICLPLTPHCVAF